MRLPALTRSQRKVYRRMVLLERCPALHSAFRGPDEGLIELGLAEESPQGLVLTAQGRKHAPLTDGMKLG